MADGPYYLETHPNTRCPQFRSPRRQALSGVVVIHTAENTPDYVAFDGGAEAVARYLSERTTYGSYHTLVDSDSVLPCVRFSDEAFHDATSGGNRHEIGLSVATRADVWPLAPKAWRDGAIRNLARAAADYAEHFYRETGKVIPARRITRRESEARIPGFISHGDRDPARRHDPGDAFPWGQFLDEYARLTAHLGNKPTSPTPDPQELDMATTDDIFERLGRIERGLIGDEASDKRADDDERERDGSTRALLLAGFEALGVDMTPGSHVRLRAAEIDKIDTFKQ